MENPQNFDAYEAERESQLGDEIDSVQKEEASQLEHDPGVIEMKRFFEDRGGDTEETTEPQAQPETDESQIKSPDDILNAPVTQEEIDQAHETVEKEEYLRLKREFKQSQRQFNDALREDYLTRGLDEKIFGLGRDKMNPSVQEKYDQFMQANQTYLEFAKTSGIYDKIENRLNRTADEKASNLNQGFEDNEVQNYPGSERVSINEAVAGRHVLRPAEQRLELQTSQLPESLQNLKGKISEQVASHPKFFKYAGVGLLAAGLWFNTAAVAAGKTAHFIEGKIGKRKAEETNKSKLSAVSGVSDLSDLEALEADYYAKIKSEQVANTRKKYTTIGAAVAAGGASEFAMGDAPSSMDLPVGESGAEPLNINLDRPIENIPGSPEVEINEPTFDNSTETLEENRAQVAREIEEAREKFHARNASYLEDRVEYTQMSRAQTSGFAEKMGIEYDPHNSQVVMEGNVVTKINGVDVPEDLYTDEQLQDIEMARSIVNVSAEAAPDASGVLSQEQTVSSSETTTVSPEVSVTPEGGLEANWSYEVVKGDTLSEIVLDGLREKIGTGEVTLPEGFNQDELYHKMLQTFPEFTSAEGVAPRLTSEQWQVLGIESGNPHLIQPGETIDMEALTKMMFGENVVVGDNGVLVESSIGPNGEVSAGYGYELGQTDNPYASTLENPIEQAYMEVPEGVREAVNTPAEAVPEDTAEPVVAPVEPAPEAAEVAVAQPEPTPDPVVATEAATAGPETAASGEPNSLEEIPESSIPEPVTYSPEDRGLIGGELGSYDSAHYKGMLHVFEDPGSGFSIFNKRAVMMQAYVEQLLAEGINSGKISLPEYIVNEEGLTVELTKDKLGYFVTERMPSVDTALFDKKEDLLTPADWKEMGISSGDPKKIDFANDELKVDRLLDYLLKNESKGVETVAAESSPPLPEQPATEGIDIETRAEAEIKDASATASVGVNIPDGVDIEARASVGIDSPHVK